MFTGITHGRLSDSAPDGPLVCSNVLISSNTTAKKLCVSLSVHGVSPAGLLQSLRTRCLNLILIDTYQKPIKMAILLKNFSKFKVVKFKSIIQTDV